MTLTTQLRKVAKKRSIESLTQSRTRHRFPKTHREISTSHNETKRNRKLKITVCKNYSENYVTFKNVQDSDNDLAEKTTQSQTIYEKNPTLKEKPPFKKTVYFKS